MNGFERNASLDASDGPRGPVGAAGATARPLGVGAALAAAAQWRLLSLWTLGMLLPTAVMTLPVWRILSVAFDHAPRAAEWARRFDALAFDDLFVNSVRPATPALAGVAMAALLTMLLTAPLVSGALAAAAQKPERPLDGRALLTEGMAYYGRMLRLMLLSWLPLAAIVGAVGGVASGVAGGIAKHAVHDAPARLAQALAIALTAIVFVLVNATVEAGRARLAADELEGSAWRAWLSGVRLLLRRPLALLALYLAPTLITLALAAVLLLVRIRIAGADWPRFALAFVIAQLGVAACGWGRAARLFALTALVRTSPRRTP